MKVAVVIPARNEEETISRMVRFLLALYGKYIVRVIVVDDGSTDKTAEIAAGLAAADRRVMLVRRRPPHGVGRALREGLRHIPSSCTHILTLDADFVRNMPELEEFFAKIGGYDGLVGSRYLERHSLIRYPFMKLVFNRAFHLLARLLFGIGNTDLTNNFKFYRKDVYLSLPLAAEGYAVNAETGLYAVLLGYRIGELPVVWFARSRSMGSSKFSLLKVAPGYVRVLASACRLRRKNPDLAMRSRKIPAVR